MSLVKNSTDVVIFCCQPLEDLSSTPWLLVSSSSAVVISFPEAFSYPWEHVPAKTSSFRSCLNRWKSETRAHIPLSPEGPCKALKMILWNWNWREVPSPPSLGRKGLGENSIEARVPEEILTFGFFQTPKNVLLLSYSLRVKVKWRLNELEYPFVSQ